MTQEDIKRKVSGILSADEVVAAFQAHQRPTIAQHRCGIAAQGQHRNIAIQAPAHIATANIQAEYPAVAGARHVDRDRPAAGPVHPVGGGICR